MSLSNPSDSFSAGLLVAPPRGSRTSTKSDDAFRAGSCPSYDRDTLTRGAAPGLGPVKASMGASTCTAPSNNGTGLSEGADPSFRSLCIRRSPTELFHVPALPQNIEEFVSQDIDRFWKWCPVPVDGLHRCALLVKLFDYCGVAHKGSNVARKLAHLDTELRLLEVFATDRIEPNQRVGYQAFGNSSKLRAAVAKCADVKALWDHVHESRAGYGRLPDFRTPLALWVLNIIMMP